MTDRSLVLRLAGPMQSWGSSSEFNWRQTDAQPTKSGIVGLLAAASGRRREDPIEDLLALRLGVRIDQPGTLLRDYHTVSDFRGTPLPSAALNASGRQKPTSPKKFTHVTQRYYLQDSVFVAVIGGNTQVLEGLASALRRPRFPLALGRRACVPTQPIVLSEGAGADLWQGTVAEVIHRVPWQAGPAYRVSAADSSTVTVPFTVDDDKGDDDLADVPLSFSREQRAKRSTRRVRHGWAELGSGSGATNAQAPQPARHNPFALLGW